MANPGRRSKSAEVLNLLLEKADVQGYLTTEDLMEFYPDVTRDAERIEAVLTALRRRGVEILDGENDSDITDNEGYAQVTDLDFTSTFENISSDDTIGLYLKEMS
ncbi:MAG TPA: RNA polymerase sigma factor region1.1 domain-containing protein, partial [Anaerolineaceae bacterium]|nr:RNA polymerase sigma factor region1.1 domain-containing protein [Anaerolineaceae bacterium]HPD63559.1 RNA polymerase sigma factor region1.1 domain-containing protein [Anaerolineaceae bacterium]